MRSPWLLGCLLVMSTILATPERASAQATRTWVSGVGDDANPCSRTAPCKTFAGAISKTAVSGEISVLDPGGFGAVTITKSINIVAAGQEAGVLAAGTQGIVINAPGANVSLRGLTIAGVTTGTNGINVVSAGNVHVEDCVIFGFSQAGVVLSSTAPSRMHIRHASIYQNAFGLQITSSGVSNGVFLEDSTLEKNTSANVSLSGANAVLALSNTTIVGSSTGITSSGGATVTSYGNNRITNGTITQTLPLE